MGSPSIPPPDSTLPKPSEVLAGKFEIEKMLGRGGMGAVFKAKHKFLHQHVAVKVLLGSIAGHKEAIDRFFREGQAAFGIQSDHVARRLDLGQLDSGAPFMVMAYLEGNDRADQVEKHGRLTVPEAVDYVIQAVDAIAQAHALGIIHRDLKPANLFLVQKTDGSRSVKV